MAEETAAMQALFGGRLDRSAYIRLLRGYRSLYRQWESQHADWLQGVQASLGWRYRRRVAALDADLAEFGVPATSLASADDLHQTVASAECWGGLYVIEGSALGGQVIARQLAQLFPYQAHRFFNLGHGRAEASWKDFQALLDGALNDSSTRRKAVRQAQTMFGVFQSMLEKVAV